MDKVQNLHHEYLKSHLDIDDLNTDPFTQFRYWFNDALKADPEYADSMVLATADKTGKVSARIILMRGFDHEGFTFYTNYDSKKGKQLVVNPNASLVFFWKELERQVRIEGTVEKTSRKESDEYFNIRPEESNISVWASNQSQPIPNREYLDKQYRDYAIRHKDKIIERPENWGGYRIIPDLFEFWQGRENRLHDRFEYTWSPAGWDITRLAP